MPSRRSALLLLPSPWWASLTLASLALPLRAPVTPAPDAPRVFSLLPGIGHRVCQQMEVGEDGGAWPSRSPDPRDEAPPPQPLVGFKTRSTGGVDKLEACELTVNLRMQQEARAGGRGHRTPTPSQQDP